MPELPGLPELKMPIGKNQWLNSFTFLVGLAMFCLTVYFYFTKDKNCDEGNGAAFTAMAKDYVASEAKSALKDLRIKRLEQDSIQNAALQWKSNIYLKKKVLNPLKKTYNEP